MSLNNELIAAVREGAQATDHAAAELERVRQMYRMTPEGVKEQAARLFKASREVADAAKARGLAAIEQACVTLDAEEQAEGERRAADTDYLARLESKLRLAQNMGDNLTDDDRARMKTLFAEFSGDPLAVAVIRKTLGENKAFFFLPDDNTGKRQQHLKTAVKKLFGRAMDKAGCDPASYGTRFEARNAELDAFCAYCNAQSEDFSRPDREVWGELYEKRKQDGAPAAPEFDMLMSMGM